MSGAIGVRTDGQRPDWAELWLDIDDDWRVFYEMRHLPGGRVVVAGLRIKAMAAERAIARGGLTNAVLRRIGFAIARRHARLNSTPVPSRRNAGPGRPTTLSPAFFQKIARRYKELQKQGTQHIPKVLAKEFGKERSTMRGIIHRCRYDFRLLD